MVLSEMGFSGFSIAGEDERPAEGTAVVAAVGLVGDLKGHFVLRLGQASAASFVASVSGHLGMKEEDPTDHQYRKAVIGEIANQISGRAAAILSGEGVEFMITPPTVIAGEGVETALPESNDRIAFAVIGGFGGFDCAVAIKRSKTI